MALEELPATQAREIPGFRSRLFSAFSQSGFPLAILPVEK